MSPKDFFLSNTTLQQQLPVFFQPWWLNIVSKNWNVALVEKEGKTTGLLPYAIDKKLGLTIIRNPLLTPYLGPYFFTEKENTSEEAVILEQLWAQLPKFASLDFEGTTDFQNPEVLQTKGCQIVAKNTYELELHKNENELFSAIHNNHRNLIRQAEKSEEVVVGLNYLPQLITFHKATFARKNKPYPFSPQLIENIVKESLQRNQGQLYAIKDKSEEITACIFVVSDQDKSYLLLSAMDNEKAHPGAIRLLIWQAIKNANLSGKNVFDFEGSMDPGIAAFFKRFGGSLKTYLCVTKHNSLLWKIKKSLLG